MRILGIDPGLADVGWGIVESDGAGRPPRHVAHGVIKTRAGEPMARRLDIIYRELQRVIDEHRPEEVSIEQLFFATNVKTAIVVAQGRGVAILATAGARLPLAEYTPLQIKLALVGYGNAAKQQVQMMVKAVLGLKEMPKPDHAADALAAALCHLHSMRPALDRARSAQRKNKESEELSPNKALLAMQRKKRTRRRG